MENAELKHEFCIDITTQCRTCLSVGRTLRPLQELAVIYKKITSECVYPVQELIECLRVCWQCYSLLKKIFLFQEQVVRANELLKTNQISIVGSLSNLVSVTINETHETIYIDGTSNDPSNIKTNFNNSKKVKNEVTEDFYEKNCKNDKFDVFKESGDIKTNDNGDKIKYPVTENFNEKKYVNDDIDVSNDSLDGVNNLDKDISDNDIEADNNYTKDKNRLKSRWALTKAEENKKPKFKLVTNFKTAFKKVHISDEELIHCIERDRHCEYYKSKRFKCDDCVLGFSHQYSLSKHNEKYHQSINCKEAKVSDKRHQLSHIRKHYFVYKCVICQYICRSRDFRAWHFEKEHKRVFQCLKCNLQFRSRREFYQHFKCWHEKFICDYCGVSFKMRYCIENHIRKQHSPFECKPCRKKFARYNGLWLHNKLAHRPASPAYCVECDRQYKDVYRLKWHLCNSVMHTPRDKLRIPCPSCDKIFTKNIYMKDHFNLVHLKVYKYRCDTCDKNFIRNADLVKHKRKIHEGILPAKNKICYMCGRGFTTNKILLNHVRTHTGERPFACGACAARFSQPAALRAHARARHDVTTDTTAAARRRAERSSSECLQVNL